MVEQTEKPEPEKITGSVDTNIMMMMAMLQEMNKNRQEDKEENKKSNEQMFQVINVPVSYTHLNQGVHKCCVCRARDPY